MTKKKKKKVTPPEEKLPEEELEVPPEELEEEALPEAPKLAIPPVETPVGDVEAQIAKLQSVVDTAIEALRRGENFSDVVRSLSDTLRDMAEAERPMGGLGLPPTPPATPPEEKLI